MESAQELAGKARQKAEEAWGTVKDTTQKIKQSVVGKAKGSIKDNADNII